MDAELAHTHLGHLLAADGQTAEGFNQLQHVLASTEHSQRESLPAAAAAPSRLMLADVEFRRGRLNAARELYEKNLSVLDTARTPEVDVHAATYSHYARLLLEDGQAVKSAEAVAASMPLLAPLQNSRAEAQGLNLVTLADLAAAGGQSAAAERQYEEVLADWPPTSTELPTPYLQAALGQIDLALTNHQPDLAVLRARNLLRVVLGMPEQQFRGDAESEARLAMGRAWLSAAQPGAAKPELARSALLLSANVDSGSPRLALTVSLLAEASRRLAPGDPPPTSAKEARRALLRFPVFDARFRSSLPPPSIPQRIASRSPSD
jgi:tetratricopeptide (TPR) repeat protein